ncbi:MAG: sigma-54 dependent transcriptional regulator [Candidatus Zixiibacteriota bacterium]
MDRENIYVLLVDDDPDFVADFKLLLPEGLICDAVSTAAEAYEYVQNNDVNVAFLDIDLGPGEDGLQLLQRFKMEFSYLPVIMITADDSTSTIVRAMQMGASDYIGKSPNLDKLKISIEQATRRNDLQQRLDFVESELDSKIGNLIGDSEPMRKIKREISNLSNVPSTVFITGKSGTGKELVAREIHRLSKRKNEPFIAVNCAALSHNLLESELFGHEKGAFTDAHSRRIGKFELTGNGTLFLDEITEIRPNLQSKLLRVLQEREFERVGGNRIIKFHGRILASSNRNISEAVKNNELREDLLYRLQVVHIELPPLSDRRDDIPLLAHYFLHILAKEMKKNVTGISDNAMALLCAYQWPGNVRDLKNSIERAIVNATNPTLDESDFSQIYIDHSVPQSYEEAKKDVLRRFQRSYITGILAKCDGNISQAAEQMGLSRQGLRKIMDECDLN